jgi:hypothetical protein
MRKRSAVSDQRSAKSLKLKAESRRRRRSDWPERLADAVRAARSRPFVWGRHDCALFAFDCVLAMTGEDHLAAFRGRYRSAKGAVRALKRIGGVKTLEELVAGILGAPGQAQTAQRGDLVLLDTEIGPALGVCLGARCAFAGPDGLAYAPTVAAREAWRV